MFVVLNIGVLIVSSLRSDDDFLINDVNLRLFEHLGLRLIIVTEVWRLD